jgi:flagellar motor switch protein FliN/FliY
MEEIGRLAEVPLALDVELGRCKMAVKDILALVPGTVVRIPRAAGEQIDILAGGALIARGEIVALDGAMHVRITDFVEAP